MSLPPDLTKAPMGGTLVQGGATFRAWAPRAKEMYVSGDFNGWSQDAGPSLSDIGGGHWAGFVSGLKDGDQYLFYVVNGTSTAADTSGYKRDPRARLLTFQQAFPLGHCVLRDPAGFPCISCTSGLTSSRLIIRTAPSST
jgi:1,4-alpha-glucan branching enzyme